MTDEPSSPSSAAVSPAARAFDAFRGRRRFGALDGVRCLCILAVIWHHAPRPAGMVAALTRGFLGVDMFFVLSGFLIVTLLLRERERTGTISLRDFYMRRTLRIFPIYYLLVLGVGALILAGAANAERASTYWHELPYLLTYSANFIRIDTVNLAIVWSLCMEEQFYLTWPWVERYVPRRAAWCVLAGLIGVNQLINFGLLDPWIAGLGLSTDLSMLDATFTPIALGVVLAHALHHRRSFTALHGVLGRPWAVPALLVALVLAVAVPSGDISGLPRLLIQLSMVLLLGSLVIREDHVLRRPLQIAPMARLGAISYGLYLYHLWGFHVARAVAKRVGIDSWWIVMILALVAAVVISELSFRFVEAWFLRLKDRFRADEAPAA